MRSIEAHEFIADEQGDLALIVNVLSFDEPNEPVLLISGDEDKAYLRRGPGDIYEIDGINPDVIGKLRETEVLVVLEVLGETATHTYDVDVAPLEEPAAEQA